MNDITYMTAVMLSYENGAQIEFKWIDDFEWTPTSTPFWNWEFFNYRVAQEKTREHTRNG